MYFYAIPPERVVICFSKCNTMNKVDRDHTSYTLDELSVALSQILLNNMTAFVMGEPLWRSQHRPRSETHSSTAIKA